VRVLNVLILTGIALAFGPPPSPTAEAAAKQALFIFQTDQFNSYWRNQREVQVQPPECPPVGPCLSVPVRLSNPDGADALAVAVSSEVREDGSLAVTPEKMSAIAFDLSERGVEDGDTINLFTLSIVEEGARNADDKVIKACRITEQWPHNETGAELWANRPPYEDGGCVAGQRQVNATEIRWTFNLTKFAGLWDDPLENNGVMFVPDIPSNAGATENWQITLKVPQPDKPATTDSNEYEETKSRVRLVYDFRKAPPEVIDDGGDGGNTGGGTGPTGPIDIPPSVPSEPVPTTVPTTEPVAEPAPAAETKPSPPGQVWLLIPVGLVALAMTRSAVEESVDDAASGRGVVASIRRRNAAARGDASEGAADESKIKRFLGRFRR
jgi:hypothetical protein